MTAKDLIRTALVWGVLFGQQLAAEPIPLYRQQFEQAVVTQEAREHAQKLLREHQDVEIRDKFVIQPFHKQSGELETAPEAFCRTCHGPLPHSKQLRNRAFNNMHVRYIACETCHFRPKDMPFEYKWFDYQRQLPVPGQNLFRTGHDTDNAKQRPDNPKIAPFYRDEPAFALKNSTFGQDIARQWKKADDATRVELRAKIHLPLEKKGPKCEACHTDKQALLNLSALGANEQESQAIVKHVIPQFFRRYEKDDQRITILDMLR